MTSVDFFNFSFWGRFFIYPIAIFWWAKKLLVRITAVWKVNPMVEWTNHAFLPKIYLMDIVWADLENVCHSIILETFFSFSCPDTILCGSHSVSNIPSKSLFFFLILCSSVKCWCFPFLILGSFQLHNLPLTPTISIFIQYGEFTNLSPP